MDGLRSIYITSINRHRKLFIWNGMYGLTYVSNGHAQADLDIINPETWCMKRLCSCKSLDLKHIKHCFVEMWLSSNRCKCHAVISLPMTSRKTSQAHPLGAVYIDGLVQERRTSSAFAMELRLSCTNPSMSETIDGKVNQICQCY